MPLSELFITLLLLVLMALWAQPLMQKLWLPFNLVLVVFGFIASELILLWHDDLGLRWQHFHDFAFYLIVPVLVFQASLKLDGRALLHHLLAILLLALPMMLLSVLCVAVVLYWGIGYPDYFGWGAALLTGAIISATDPSTLLDIYRKAGISDSVLMLLEGESLFNDTFSIVMFSALSAIALMPQQSIDWQFTVLQLLVTFGLSICLGLVVAVIMLLLLRWTHSDYGSALISFIAVWGGYLSATQFELSGVLVVLVTGLAFAEYLRRRQKPITLLDHGWSLLAELSNHSIFLMLGVTVTLAMFQQQWLAMMLGIVAMLVARGIGLLCIVPVINAVTSQPINCREAGWLGAGGTRGAVAIALALSLPIELGSWYTIQSIVYGVVLFTLSVQAVSVIGLLNRSAKV